MYERNGFPKLLSVGALAITMLVSASLFFLKRRKKR